MSTLIERDALELASIERRGDLLKLVGLLAGRTGGLLVPAALANQSGIPRTTFMRYLELLSSVFLIKSIPAWSSDKRTEPSARPNWPSLTLVSQVISSARMPLDSASQEARPGR